MMLAIDPAWMKQLAAESDVRGEAELAARFHFDDPLLALLVERLVLEYEQPGPADSLYTQSLMQAVGAHLVRTCAVYGAGQAGPKARAGELSPRRLAAVIDYMQANLGSTVTLEQLAAAAGVSTSHLTRMFRAATGQAPYQYLMRQRLECARRALLYGDAPIAAVALAAGFAGQSHLTRTMRRHLNVTPSILRAAREAG
ncbi:helix-turn-helix domain-containing protein [Streptomyces sp. NBC_00658]|uniref:helix-turn-helix domain-containing protein n=1 Tax=Streptomyces sp. NBC_00658 TaxID=2975800 RepID=UPI0032461468